MAKFTSLYKCPDGTDFTVEWEDPSDSAISWRWNQDHWPLPTAPLDAAIGWIGQSARDRTYADAGLLVPAAFRSFLRPQGFVYLQNAPLSRAERAVQDEAVDRLTDHWGGVLQVWEEYCLPRIRDYCWRLQEAPADTAIADLGDIATAARHLTHVSGQTVGLAMNRFVAFCQAHFGQEGQALAYDVTQGYANATTDADQALWDLARLANASPDVKRALLTNGQSAHEAISGASGSAEFAAAFQRYLDLYGWRAEGWQLDAPTWRERPDIPLSHIRRIIGEAPPQPNDAVRQGAQRRQAIIADTENRLPPAERAEFHALLAPLAHYVAIREARALWQLIANGSLRTAVLRRSRRLTDDGLIPAAESVFFLLPEEIESPGMNLGSLTDQRREDWQRWCEIQPPEFIGADSPSTARVTLPPASDQERVIRGIAASRGVVTARAKVLTSLDEANKLQSGDVLVCVMTSPPWTILFGRAAAVVTDTGSILSHPSIAAREYGIPCVVGTRVATKTIRDGMRITVDGSQGIVRLGE